MRREIMLEVKVYTGTYRNNPVENEVFTLIKPYTVGAKGGTITVDATPVPGFPDNKIRILVPSPDAFEVVGNNGTSRFEPKYDLVDSNGNPAMTALPGAAEALPNIPTETDDEIIARIRDRFDVLKEMTNAAVDGVVRGMVVTGPPGVGKTYGVEKVIDEASTENKLTNRNPMAKYGIETGAATPIGLYQLLYDYSDKGSVLVLDDSDSVLYDEVSLNLLKAALDSGKKRKLSWRSESRALDRNGVPDEYEFKGSVIFITNLKFDKARGKIADHLGAILSRCHYLDLTMDSARDKMLRCKQIVNDGMLMNYRFDDYETAVEEIMNYMVDNEQRLRELSLRMVTKIADLRKMSPKRWQTLAESTCLYRGA